MKKIFPTFDYEIKYEKEGNAIAGFDEVGRGALAGPIVAGAVVFKRYEKVIQKLVGVTDSKLLTPLKRMEFDEKIKSVAADFAIGVVEAREIDKFGIGAANVMAFERALKQIKKCDMALIDGRKFRGFPCPFICLERGETKSLSIAAASIIAKVYRDTLMQNLHEEIFRYDFGSNKGYGSSRHLEALKKYGPSHFHRKSFLHNFNQHKEQQILEI